jgi:urease accessory protein
VDPDGPAVRELSAPARSRVGRDGFLRLAFARRGARTVLVDRCYRTPLQVLEALDFPDDPALGVLLLNPTGGVLGGDRLTTTLTLAEGSHAVVTTPSATRVYGSRADAAVLRTEARIDAGAVLEYVPDHTILHPEARLHQSFEADLAPGARLLSWDAWALGRVARGETWRFASLTNHVRVLVDGAPIHVDRTVLAPARRTLDALGGSEGAGYVASWIVAGEGDRPWGRLADDWGDAASAVPGVSAAGSALRACGAIVRVLAPSAYGLLEAYHSLWDAARRDLLGLPPLDLRKA